MASHTHSYATRRPSGPFKPKPRALTDPATQSSTSYLTSLKPDEQYVVLRAMSKFPRRPNWLSFVAPSDLKMLMKSPLRDVCRRRCTQVVLCMCCPIISAGMRRRIDYTWFSRPFDYDDEEPGFARVDQHSLPLFGDATHVRFSCTKCFVAACPGPSLSQVLPVFRAIECVDFSGIKESRRLGLFIQALPTHLLRVTMRDPGELNADAIDHLQQSGTVELRLLGRGGNLRTQPGFWKAMHTLRKLHMYSPVPADIQQIRENCPFLEDIGFYSFGVQTTPYIVALCGKLKRRLKVLTLTAEHLSSNPEMYEKIQATCNAKVSLIDDTGLYEKPMDIFAGRLQMLRCSTVSGLGQSVYDCNNLRHVEVCGSGYMLTKFLRSLFDSCQKIKKLYVRVIRGELKSLTPLNGLTEFHMSASKLPIGQFNSIVSRSPALEKVKIEALGKADDDDVLDILECFARCEVLKMLEISRWGYTRFDPESVSEYRDYCVSNFRTRRTHVSVFSCGIAP